MSGAAARARAEAEAAKQYEQQEQRAIGHISWEDYNQRRFYLSNPNKPPRGENSDPRYEAEIVILDRTLDDLVFAYEHRLQNPNTGFWDIVELCCKENGHCLICNSKADRGPSYVMHASVLDLHMPMTDRNPKGVLKRPLPIIGASAHKAWFKLFDAAMAAHGTIRGMHVIMRRATDDPYASAIGFPVMWADGSGYKMIPEAELVKEFGHPEIRGDAGQLLKAANSDITPFDYRHIFPIASEADQRARLFGGTGAGTQAEVNQEWNQGADANAPQRTRAARTATGVGGGAPQGQAPLQTPLQRTRRRPTQDAGPVQNNRAW